MDSHPHIIKLLKEYGDDFFAKCKHYRTARLDGIEYNIVGLLEWRKDSMSFLVFKAGATFEVSIDRLDNFVL